MVRLENVLKISLQDVLKTSWRRFEDVLKMSWRPFCKTSWRRLENVLKTSWRRIAKTNILVLTKTSSEDVRLRRTYSSWSRRLEDVFWRRRRKTSSRSLQDVFIKTSVCWVYFNWCGYGLGLVPGLGQNIATDLGLREDTGGRANRYSYCSIGKLL